MTKLQLLTPALEHALHGDAVLHSKRAVEYRAAADHWSAREAGERPHLLRESNYHIRRVLLIAQRIDTYLRAAQTGA